MSTIRDRFAARWVTIWKAPAYEPLALQLARQGGMKVYDDAHYQVWDLGNSGAQPSQ